MQNNKKQKNKNQTGMKKQVASGKKAAVKAPKVAVSSAKRVGRPKKTGPTESAMGIKFDLARKNRLAAKKAGTSTRDLIVATANEIINRTGVVDFRIETLAQSLGLSPGNITYHFPKKEDIIAAIWEEFLTIMNDIGSDMITPLLDIKQLFLFYRSLFGKAINYVGVTTYYYGDMGALLRENKFYLEQMEDSRDITFRTYDMLHRNGYINRIDNDSMKELIFNSSHIMFRWWINHALTKVLQNDLTVIMDKYIALCFLQLMPFLTEEGRKQFQSINNLIK